MTRPTGAAPMDHPDNSDTRAIAAFVAGLRYEAIPTEVIERI